MPELVKIGKTTRGVAQRASELYQTGVPTPFVIDHSVLSPDCDELESTMHDLFRTCRINGSREFFRITKNDIGSLPDELNHCLRLQMQTHVNEYLVDHEIVRPDLIVDEVDLDMIASQTNYHPAEVASALRLVTPEELEPAMARFREVSTVRRLRAVAEKDNSHNVVEIGGAS